MSSEADIAQDDVNNNNDGNNNDDIKYKKTRSEIYGSFTFNEVTSRWHCKYCR